MDDGSEFEEATVWSPLQIHLDGDPQEVPDHTRSLRRDRGRPRCAWTDGIISQTSPGVRIAHDDCRRQACTTREQRFCMIVQLGDLAFWRGMVQRAGVEQRPDRTELPRRRPVGRGCGQLVQERACGGDGDRWRSQVPPGGFEFFGEGVSYNTVPPCRF
jgi:hypothetical protein